MAHPVDLKQDQERIFAEPFASLQKTDPEFFERFCHFAFHEVLYQSDLDAHSRLMAILATLLGSQSLDAFRDYLPVARKFGVTPVEIKEIVYQAVAYLGMGRVYPFLCVVNERLIVDDTPLPLENLSTTTWQTRLEAGNQAQVDIFGEDMRGFQNRGPEESRHINRWLAENCFGDYYTRKGLDYKQREMITFCFLLAQGGCESQLVSHAVANLRIGNDKRFLIKVVSQCLPSIGYPRSLNAIRCIYEAADKVEEKDFKKDASLPSEESFSKST